MNNILLFLLVCIPLRSFFAFSSQLVPKEYLKYFGMLLLILALSFFYLFISNQRLDAPEAGGKTWWAPLRLIIGSFYLVAAIYAFMGRQDLVWVPMSMDVLFGLITFTMHHQFAWNP
jgi:hypothetical protein